MPVVATEVSSGPLGRIRVVEVGQYISGPYAAKVLADMGADVIKVESVDGDPMRRWEGAVAGTGYSPQFAAYNRNKSSVVLDLKSSDGLGKLLELAAESDVLIENFRPGVADRLGFGAAALARLNPRLVSCSISGFGPTGPYAALPAYDTVISAVGGMYAQITDLDAARPIGPAFSDILAGSSAVQAVLAALVARESTGLGQHVEVTMVGALLDFLAEAAGTYLQTGQVSGPDTRSRRAQAYLCLGSDGKAFVIHMSVPEKFWVGLLGVLERPDLADDPRFSSREGRVANYEQLDAILKEEARRHPRQYWMDRLAGADIPHGPLNRISELFDDPQLRSMELLTSVEDADGATLSVARHSVTFHGSGRPEYRAAPLLGADTQRLTSVRESVR